MLLLVFCLLFNLVRNGDRGDLGHVTLVNVALEAWVGDLLEFLHQAQLFKGGEDVGIETHHST